jgi:hypothetical protein
MYTKKKFSNGIRSQEGIRKVTRAIKSYPSDARTIKDFFVKEKEYSELPTANISDDNQTDIVDMSKQFRRILSNVDVENFSEMEHQELKRTWKVLNQVLYNAS